MGPKGKSKALVDAQYSARSCASLSKKVSAATVRLQELNTEHYKLQNLIAEKELLLRGKYNELFQKQVELNQIIIMVSEEDVFLERLKEHGNRSAQLSSDIKKYDAEIKNKRHKVGRRKRILAKTNAEISFFQNVRSIAYSITSLKQTKRKFQPTDDDLMPQSKVVRCNETFQASSIIHGGSKRHSTPVMTGIIQTLARKFPVREVAQYMTKSTNYLTSNLSNAFINTWHNQFYVSTENKLRSLSIYYSHHVMGKRKYRAIRKANRNSIFQKKKIANFIAYKELSNYINDIDIGVLHPISNLLEGGAQVIAGMYRDVSSYIQKLAGMYLKLNESREDKLLEFNSFDKKNKDSFLFLISFGGDGAPGVGTVYSVCFLNVGKRVSSSKETFVVFGGDVAENALVSKLFVAHAVNCFEFLESKVFTINGVSVEFKLTELPNDMKMLAFLAGELGNSATYFTTFADVSSRNFEHRDTNNSFGISGKCKWKPFEYKKRVADAKLVAKKKKTFNVKNTAKTNRTKITEYIANTLQSRQEVEPLMKKFIVNAKCDPLHLKNNVTKEFFIKLWKVLHNQCEASSTQLFSSLPDANIFVHFVAYIKGEVHLNQLSRKMVTWFNETNRGIDKDFQFRFRGEETFGFLTFFARTIHHFLPMMIEEDSVRRLIQIHYQLILLRKIVAYSVRVTHFSHSDLEDMRDASRKLFRASCQFETSTSPSMWVTCNVAHVHAECTLKLYGMGLGVNSMEAREQKHQMVKKYAENATVQNKWQMVFRHEYLQNVYLREHGFDEVRYHKKGKCYLLGISDGSCPDCGLTLVNAKCPVCSHRFMTEIVNSI